MKPSRDIAALIEIIAALRAPATGCPWDLAQDFASITTYLIEEAHEVAHAIALGDLENLRDELGDLLFHVVFQARLAQEDGAFDFADVVESITTKMIRRHPHVFDEPRRLTLASVKELSDEIKAKEKEERALRRGPDRNEPESALSEVPVALPALTRTLKLQQQASKVGFDSRDSKLVLTQIRKQVEGIEATVAGQQDNAANKLGDLLFAVVNLARHLDADPEGILRAANRRFEQRFAEVERSPEARGEPRRELQVSELDYLWDFAKQAQTH
jgi:ATP diphosphatase